MSFVILTNSVVSLVKAGGEFTYKIQFCVLNIFHNAQILHSDLRSVRKQYRSKAKNADK